MKLRTLVKDIEIIDSIIGLVGVLAILSGAIFVQLFHGEQPCPLCLLQRAAFVGIGISLLMNLRYQNKVAHWALAIICAITGMAVSLRQICLHITSAVGFGSPFLGIHMYTWCFIAFFITIVGCGLMLLIYPEKK